MANPNFRAPDSASDEAPPHSNGTAPAGSPRQVSLPLDRMSQSERNGDGEAGGDLDASAAIRSERDRAQSLALYEGANPDAAALDTADDASMREFYGRLVNLLTQDGEGEAARKKGRNGLLVALRRRWLPALLVAGLAFFALFSVLKPHRVTFTATTQFLLPPHASQGDKDPFASPEDTYDTAAQMAIVGSDKIVSDAMSHVPPALRKAGWGAPDITGAPVGVSSTVSDSLINLSATSDNPQASLRFVNEMVRAYAKYSKNRYTANRTGSVKSTQSRLQETQKALDQARRDLRNYKERTGIFDATSQQGSSATNIAELGNQLEAARRESATVTADDMTLQGLRQRAVDAGVVRNNVLRDFESGSDRARAAQEAYDTAQSAAETRAGALTTASQQRIAGLQSSLDEARRKAALLPQAEQELNRLNQRLTLATTDYNAAAERNSQLALAGGAAPQGATILQPPGVSDNRGLQRVRALGVSVLGALLLGLGAAMILDRFDHSVRAAPDPEALFGAPILGALPAVKSRQAFIGQTEGGGSARARTAILEACYTAQSHILSAASNLGARSILITSSLPEEGKSQCAANLAAAMAYGGRQVLLIDADFWHPSQHEILGQELAPGFAQALRDEVPLSQTIRSTQVPNLHLLTAGQKVNPNLRGARSPDGAVAGTSAEMAALLSGEHHFQVMQIFKRYFDVVIVDAPPVMSVADAQLLAGLTDATVLVTADRTNRDQVQRARSMLRLAGAVLLGVVVNSVRLGEVGRWDMDFSPEEPFSNYSSSLSQRF